MKRFGKTAVMAIFGALTLSGLHAQTVNVRATIPFNFNAGKVQMPAGEYQIRGEGHLVLLRRVDEGKPTSAFVQTIGATDRGARTNARLSFNRYGNEYFLSGIWDGSSADGRELFRSAREKELARRAILPMEATVVAIKK